MELKEKLAVLRTERDLTQDELARELNVTRQTVSKWERGLATPDAVNLTALGRLYGVSLDELVNGPSPQEEPAPAEGGEAPLVLQPSPIRVRQLGWKAIAVCGTLCLIAVAIMFYFSVFKGSERETPAPMDELGQDSIVITGNLKWEPIE